MKWQTMLKCQWLKITKVYFSLTPCVHLSFGKRLFSMSFSLNDIGWWSLYHLEGNWLPKLRQGKRKQTMPAFTHVHCEVTHLTSTLVKVTLKHWKVAGNETFWIMRYLWAALIAATVFLYWFLNGGAILLEWQHFKNIDNTKCRQRYGAIRILSYCWYEWKNCTQTPWKTSWRFLVKLNIYLLSGFFLRVECLLCKCKASSSSPSPTKKKKKRLIIVSRAKK
jgi:hypothetical protein